MIEVQQAIEDAEDYLARTTISYPEYRKRLQRFGPSYAEKANWGLALSALRRAREAASKVSVGIDDFGAGGE
jgi:hypothetical protein